MNKYTLGIIALIIVGFAAFQVTPEPDVPETAPDNTTENSSVLGDPVVTDVKAQMVTYHNDTAGYLVTPAGEGPFPGIILIHEWWGLNQNIKDLAEDFAQQGYAALAVDLYDGAAAETPDQASQLAGGVRDNTELAFANLTSATEYLKGLDNVTEDSLASVGWCFGGQWAYNMAANNMGIDASVMYYGRFSMEDDLSMMRADILGHFGEEDRSIAVDDVKQFEAKLSTLEGDHAVFIYPNAGHAFANEDREDAYNEEAAQLAWERTMDFLGRELE